MWWHPSTPTVLPSPNSSFVITIKPQGTENYTATVVILHHTKKLCYCKLCVFKALLSDTIPCNKMSRLKKTHSGWRLNFLLPLIFYCSDWLQKSQGRALIWQQIFNMFTASSAYETIWRNKFSVHILTVSHHEYNLLLLLTQGKMDVLLTNLFSWTYYMLLMELLLFDCQSW